MQKLFNILGAMALAIAVLIHYGCASAPKNIYKAEDATVLGVDAGMKAWGDYVQSYHPGTNVEGVVRDAFIKYQAAMIMAIDAGRLYTSQVGSGAATSQDAKAAATAASLAAGQAGADLLNLLAQWNIIGPNKSTNQTRVIK